MINFRQIFLFSILIINQNSLAFDSSDRNALGRDVTDEILTWPALDTELIDLDAIVAEPLIIEQPDNIALDFQKSKRLREELRDADTAKCKVCSRRLHSQTLGVLNHYRFGRLVLGNKTLTNDHFATLVKVCERPEYAETIVHFSERIKKERAARDHKRLKK